MPQPKVVAIETATITATAIERKKDRLEKISGEDGIYKWKDRQRNEKHTNLVYLYYFYR